MGCRGSRNEIRNGIRGTPSVSSRVGIGSKLPHLCCRAHYPDDATGARCLQILPCSHSAREGQVCRGRRGEQVGDEVAIR